MTTALLLPASQDNSSSPDSSCRRMDLYKEPTTFSSGRALLSANVTSSDAEPWRIWFEIPEIHYASVTDSLDPFVIACIFTAMRKKTHLHVHGGVSKRLLCNLEEFQAAWSSWLPDKYTPAELVAEREVETIPEASSNLAVAAFSGGVDSAYTIFRRKRCAAGAGTATRRHAPDIDAGLLIHGFDIPLEQEVQFERAAQSAKATLASIGVKLLTLKCNLYHPDWEMTHGAALAACLTLFKKRYRYGLIASTYPYNLLNLPWGSNPITDQLLSGSDFSIVHDSCDRGRDDKQKALLDWDEGFNNLRVCYSAEDRDKNCGRCPKCVMALISFQALNLPRPRSFQGDVTDQDILSLVDLNEAFAEVFVNMVETYRHTELAKASWFPAFRRCASYNKRRIELERPLSAGEPDWWRRVLLHLHKLRGV